MWTLIMTLIMSNGGVAIQTIQVDSYEDCNNAGQAWILNIPKMPAGHYPARGSILCVENGK